MSIYKVYIVILLMLFLANLPFMISDKVFYIFSLSYKYKRVKIYLIEWVLNFIIFLFISFGLERSIFSHIYFKDKKFYLILLCLYIVFSFPGVVLRYFYFSSVNRR